MINRPRAGETDEDLLRQEEDFLKQYGKEPSKKRSYDLVVKDHGTTSDSSIIGEVVERNTSNIAQPDIQPPQKKGFPTLFSIDPNVDCTQKGKKSLFALHMERKKNRSNTEEMVRHEQNKVLEESSGDSEMRVLQYNSEILNNTSVTQLPRKDSTMNSRSQEVEMESVHQENLEKLLKMSEAEILDAQKKLMQTLDPKLIDLLKRKGREKLDKDELMPLSSTLKEVEMKARSDVGNEKIEEKLASYVGEEWVNLDFIEKEKLEWLGDIPDSKSLEPNQPYSARFDFKGELQPFTSETIDVTKSLYHHGEEPQRPGYTIQELYQLSRSSVLQQRILAINTLANIIRKTKIGYYDMCFDGHLLHKLLLEADLFLLLRFSIDENALIPAVINCLRRLLYYDSDEYCLDKLLGMSPHDVQPLLYDKIEASEEEEKELKDDTIIYCDLIKGVLRTDFLVRLTYILNNLPCDRETITNAILCFIRIARHSVKSSRLIASQMNFLDFIYSTINCAQPIYQGIKLFRLLVSQSKDVASQIFVKYPMNFLLMFLNLECMTEISKSEFFLLKLESVYLWKSFIYHDCMIDEFRSWTPCFLRLLRFYIEKADLAGGDFDFELFSALSSLLTLCIIKKIEIDINYIAMMYICTEKWLKQLLQFGKFNYASLKALGNCFGFLNAYFSVFKVEQTGLSFILKLNTLILSALDSKVFETLTQNLTIYSHLIVAREIKRDPKNFPSLCSVYEGGHDFLKIVQSQSSLPFFIQFIHYLKTAYSVSHDCKNSLIQFLLLPDVRKYVTAIMKMKKNVYSWFNRYELKMLTDILNLLHVTNSPETRQLCFRLIPLCRNDDINVKNLLSLLTTKEMWDSVENFDDLSLIFSQSILRDSVSPVDTVMRYKAELVGYDWLFKVVSFLRGKDAVYEMSKILKFICLVGDKEPEIFEQIPCNIRYYYLCSVFLTDSNVFDDEIQNQLQKIFRNILLNRDKVKLVKKLDDNKSLYDLYTELITQYAAVSYGLHIFAKFVLFPLLNRFDISFRKLVWSEYLHVLKVITLPYPAPDFIDVKEFSEPCETDESLLVTYLNSVSNNVISRNRNPFVYFIAVSNVKNYLQSENTDSKLANFLKQKIKTIKNERIKQDLDVSS